MVRERVRGRVGVRVGVKVGVRVGVRVGVGVGAGVRAGVGAGADLAHEHEGRVKHVGDVEAEVHRELDLVRGRVRVG